MPQSSVDPTVAANLKAVLEEKGRTAYSVATAINHAPNWLYRVMNEKAGILIPTLREVAEELGVPLSTLVDPPSETAAGATPVDPIIAESAALYGHQTEDEPQGIPVIEIAAAAGGGASVFDETPVGTLWFRQDWLRRQGIRAEHCAIINVRGKSMEPALPDGCSVLVDRSRRGLRASRIYVMRTEEGLVVKRAQRNVQGWWLMSDNPQWPPMALTEETDIIGEVRWMARTL